MDVVMHGASHQGLVRTGNEDAFVCGSQVFAVADGLGGHNAGEVASRLALGPLAALDGGINPGDDLAQVLAQAIRSGNDAVLADAQANPERHGMGTTVTAAALCDGAAHLAHVGDSRAYLLRPPDSLWQLTADHTQVAEQVRQGLLSNEEAAVHPERNVLLRVVGLDPEIDVDTPEPVALAPGDRLLLCSDGLNAVLNDEAIGVLLGGADDPEAVCDELIRATLAGGAPDNVTLVVVFVR